MPVAYPGRKHLSHWKRTLAALALLALCSLLGSGMLRAAAPLGENSAPALQAWIDATASGNTLRLPAGTYRGPVVITRPIHIDGRGEVRIDGGGKGTVVTVRASGVTLSGLTITHSGHSHDAIDSGLLLEKANGNRIENNVIENTLFGITLQQSNDNEIVGNRIRSISANSADRGDGIRLWYSTGNRIVKNDIANIRDITVTNSPRNRFIGNRIEDSRRALNLLFSHRTFIEDNLLTHNSTGITTLNSEGIVVRGNRIMHAMDASGAGIALKEGSAALIQGNEIIHCAVGIIADSALHPVNRIVLLDNRIAHNITGINFYGERGGRLVLRNRFEHNLWHAQVGGNEDDPSQDWLGNYWDDYEGFDRNHDGIGDTPHEIWAYTDRIWMENPMAKFFRNSPALELLDFLERLAPFALPTLIVRDAAPQAHDRR